MGKIGRRQATNVTGLIQGHHVQVFFQGSVFKTHEVDKMVLVIHPNLFIHDTPIPTRQRHLTDDAGSQAF